MATRIGSVWPFLTGSQRAAEIARRGTTTQPAPPRAYHQTRPADLQCAAAEEAKHHEEWADGMTPDEYLLALVDRGQERMKPPKEKTDE
ncbi:hypothetical protein [Nocardiopsis sp. NRRL B-16309]|uniref:hypothetical protein n=1 Tax=Nocardiopsis sp. NRRL B-16309 TaxID=1519494 RepID=UPI000AD15CCB|nr:hypothetical protein [Nocardiopsis sp. NRRL B-16309]